MNKPLKLIAIGNSTGIILPKEMLARLRVAQGDEVYMTEDASGFRMTPSNPEFAHKMALAEDIMREDRDILRILAQ